MRTCRSCRLAWYIAPRRVTPRDAARNNQLAATLEGRAVMGDNRRHKSAISDGPLTRLLDAELNRRRFLGTAAKLAAAPALAQALAMGSVGRAFAQAPAVDQTLRLAYTNPV